MEGIKYGYWHFSVILDFKQSLFYL